MNRIKYSAGRTGQVLHFGKEISGYLFRPLAGETNSDSLVLRLVYGKISFLFSGDAEAPAEEQLLTHDLRSTVLKVGHHGSRASTTDPFLRAVAPRLAVISVGRRNRYRHPAPVTVARLEQAGVKIYRTDRDGTVVVRTDGIRLKGENWKQAPCSTIPRPAL